MAHPESYRRRRGVLGMAVILALLPVWLLTSGQAYALNSGCRTDPVIILSNGAFIDMSAAIGTSMSQVQEVTYTLHAPRGTWPIAVVHTPHWPTTVEDFQFFADAAPGSYSTDTIAYTTENNVNV